MAATHYQRRPFFVADRKEIMVEGCRRWTVAELHQEDMYEGFERLLTFTEESHLIRRLQRCTECGQLYFYEFYEEIDWVNGNDPQYRTLIPVTSVGDAVALSHVSSIELLAHTPQLRSDWPSDAERPVIYWARRRSDGLLHDRKISDKSE